MLFNRDAFAATYINGEIAQQQQQDKQFLYKAINHVFPAGGAQEGGNLLGGIKSIYATVVNSIFFIDLNDPYSFIEPQFPGMTTYNQLMASELDENRGVNNPLPVTSQDIYFVDVDDEAIEVDDLAEVDNPEDYDYGDNQTGIYLPDTDVVDSRSTSGDISLEGLKLPEKIDFEEGKPHILVYHTHGTESYKPASEGNYHTLNKQYSVIAVAEIVVKELEKQGFNVIHDTTYHDYPSFNGSYGRSLVTAQEILKANPSIKVVLDIHRDGFEFPDNENLIRNNQWSYNNETMAKYYFVIGEKSPNRQEVETFGRFVKAVSDQMYPGFSKPLFMKPYILNTSLVDHYALVELGSNANTIEEAKRSAYYFAEVIAESLKLISK